MKNAKEILQSIEQKRSSISNDFLLEVESRFMEQVNLSDSYPSTKITIKRGDRVPTWVINSLEEKGYKVKEQSPIYDPREREGDSHYSYIISVE